MIFRIFSFLFMSVFLLISGCAGGIQGALAKKPLEENFDSPTVLAVELNKHYSGIIDRPFISTSIPVDSSGQFKSANNFWCEPLAYKSSIAINTKKFADICSTRGGVFIGDFCIKSVENDEVLFMAKIRVLKTCDFGTEVQVIEPTGSIKAIAYVEKLRSLGYKTIEDREKLKLDRVKQKGVADAVLLQRQRDNEFEFNRRTALLPQMRKIGAKVCKNQDGNTYVGYVENISDEKLQIRVNNAYVTRVPAYSPANFKPEIIWDYPMMWDLCN